MLCYRCGSHVPDGTEACGTCGQKFALGLKPGPIAGFGTGTRRHRIAVESSPYKVGDVIAGRFEIKDNVGAGPIGWVYKCLDREIDVDVSLKVISPRFLQQPEERKQLLAALRQTRRLSHANIVRVYEDGEFEDRVFFTMQHLEGLTLRRIWDLRRQKGQLFALREVEPIVAQMAQALEYAHDVFAHGDLKPDNVLVLPDLLKITDFGLAPALPRAPFMAAQKTGGVHRYLAPEFLHGERLSPRVDVFSLGVILGEMLAGAPFEGQGFDLLARNATLPREVDLVFRKAVSFKPEERFASAGDLAQALSEASGERPAPQRQPTPPPPARPTASQPVVQPVVQPVAKPAPTAPAVQMAPPPEAPIATPVSPHKVVPPKHAGSGTVREVTEEIGDDAIEELLDGKPELRLPKPQRAPEPPRQGPSVVAADTQPPTPKGAKVEKPAAALQQAPTPKSSPKVEPKLEQKPEPKAEQKQKDAKKEQKAEPKAPAKEQKPASKPAAPAPKEAKNEPAWSGSAASVPPPKEVPKTLPPAPAQPAANRNPMLIAGLLVVAIIAVFVYIAVTEKDPAKKASEPTPAVAAVKPPEPTAAPAEQPAQPAAEPEKVAAKADSKADSKSEPKADAKSAKAEQKAEQKAEAKAEQKAAELAKKDDERKKADEEAAARKAQQDEALRRLAEQERAAAAEKAASEKAAAEKLASEKAAEKAAAEKAAAEKKADATVASAGGTTCPGGMRLIQAGSFKFGAPDSDDLKNFGEIDLAEAKTTSYCIDVYESPNNSKVKPTAGVTWKQAADSCRAQHKRLCREEEWERACKGPGGSARFPYGKVFDAAACNTEDADGNPRDLTFPGSFPKCVSGFGIFDMAGNVAEWVDGVFEDGGSEKVIKGGAADRPDFATRCAARGKKAPAAKDKLLGFRCCADPK